VGALALMASGVVACGGSSRLPRPQSRPVTLPAVQSRIVLDRTRVFAGTPIHGEALLTNTTRKTITVQACSAGGWFRVGLINARVSFEPADPLIACRPSVRLRPGVNRVPITVSTSYLICTQKTNQPAPDLPACIPTGMPPLPAGEYSTKTIATGLPAGSQAPRTIHVTLVRPPG
jgi:hypothetical protein